MGTIAALRNNILQHPLHAPEVGNLGPHIIEMSRSNFADIGAWLVAFVDKVQQLTDFLEGEAKFARPQDEAHASLVRGVVAPVAGGGTWRRGQKANLLVIANRFQVAPGPLGELRPLHTLHHGVMAHWRIPVDPVAATEWMLTPLLDLGQGEVEMAPSRAGTKGTVPTASGANERALGRQHLVAFGGIIGALAASSCCIAPLILFSLGIGGAWISRLTALAPYKPLFVTAAAIMLGYGFYLVYWKPAQACAGGTACVRPISTRIVRLSLWVATLIVLAAFGFDYVAPLLLGTS